MAADDDGGDFFIPVVVETVTVLLMLGSVTVSFTVVTGYGAAAVVIGVEVGCVVVTAGVTADFPVVVVDAVGVSVGVVEDPGTVVVCTFPTGFVVVSVIVLVLEMDPA